MIFLPLDLFWVSHMSIQIVTISNLGEDNVIKDVILLEDYLNVLK